MGKLLERYELYREVTVFSSCDSVTLSHHGKNWRGNAESLQMMAPGVRTGTPRRREMTPELKVNYRARIWAERKSYEVTLNVSLMIVPGRTI